jgi:hypothetical protein
MIMKPRVGCARLSHWPEIRWLPGPREPIIDDMFRHAAFTWPAAAGSAKAAAPVRLPARLADHGADGAAAAEYWLAGERS